MRVIDDLSTLTSISITTLSELEVKAESCILHSVVESEKDGETTTEVDLDIGVLYIYHIGDEIKYKFIPSRIFESRLIDTINTGKSPLVHKIEDSLSKKIRSLYKELM